MVRNFSSKTVSRRVFRTAFPLLVMAVLVVSCSKDETSKSANTLLAAPSNGIVAASNNTPANVALKRKLTPEEQAVVEMQDLLSDGKELSALRAARNLMDSKNANTRSAVLETFQWIGKRAISEITEMINDANPQVSAEAIQAWEMAFWEIDGEHRKALVIEESVAKLKRQDDIEAILNYTSELELRIALPMLSRIIESNKTTLLGECARENYLYLTDGDVYENSNKSKQCLQKKEIN